MANAHLPNSDPRVTPDWIHPKTPLTSIKTVLDTITARDGGNIYEGNVPKDWCTPSEKNTWMAHGGVICSMLMTTSKLYFATKHPERKQPDVLHLRLQFMTPIPSGKILMEIRELKVGLRSSVIEMIVTSPKVQNGEEICVHATVLHGSLGPGPGFEAPVDSNEEKNNSIRSIQIKKEDLPDRSKDCVRWASGLLFASNPPTARYRGFTVSGRTSPLWNQDLGQNRRDMWLKVDDESEGRMSLAHIPVIIDMVSMLPLNYEKDPIKALKKWVFPTVCLSLDIKHDPEDEEWLLQRAEMVECSEGRNEIYVKLIDSQGRIVATSQQTYVILPRHFETAVKEKVDWKL